MANFAKIVEIDVPLSADEGEMVDVFVKVKNLYSEGAITITVTGVANYTDPLPLASQELVGPGEIMTFQTSFTMPNKNTVLHIGSWYLGVSGEFVLDDRVQANISISTVEEPPPPPEKKKAMEWPTLAVIAAVAAVGVVLVRR